VEQTAYRRAWKRLRPVWPKMRPAAVMGQDAGVTHLGIGASPPP
jgi:hypothetical protein